MLPAVLLHSVLDVEALWHALMVCARVLCQQLRASYRAWSSTSPGYVAGDQPHAHNTGRAPDCIAKQSRPAVTNEL